MIDFNNPARLMQLLKNPGRIAHLLQEDPGTGHSPGAIFADIFNTMRADTKRLAEVHGVDMDIEMMSEARAAELLSTVISGEGAELIAAFNREAERRDRVLRAALDDDEYDQFMEMKLAHLLTEADGEFREEDLYADTEPVDVASKVREDADGGE